MTQVTSKKRTICLYRVSTKGQVEKNDIPMQKERCREFAAQMGWEIIKEVSEKGVSGFKVEAKNRDAIQEIQQHAVNGEFDVLLVFMFDRLGRRDDETPFVVEWFANNGIEVWSAEEGQRRFDNHVDKLMNYIRYWQASGESIKTSIRTKTRLGQIVKEGRYRGGTPPYGYRLEKQGRVNKKNQEVYELVVDEKEAAVVRMIFDKYVNEGYGAQRLDRFLLEQGIRNRKGDNFANTTLIKMLKNPTYLGILRSGESQSEIFPALQIIDQSMFDRAQEIMKARTLKHGNVPLNTKAHALLSGLVYCGHCGSKLVLVSCHGSAGAGRPQRDIRYKYQCHYKVRHPQSCDGQTGYSVQKLDRIVEDALMALLEQIREIPTEDLVKHKYRDQMDLLTIKLENAKKEYKNKSNEISIYEMEISKAILGESKWDAGLLQKMIAKTQDAVSEAEKAVALIQQQIDDCVGLAATIQKEYEQMVGWAKLYSTSSMEAKKMIAAQLIKQVRVYKNYQRVEIDFNISKEDFQSVTLETGEKEPKANSQKEKIQQSA